MTEKYVFYKPSCGCKAGSWGFLDTQIYVKISFLQDLVNLIKSDIRDVNVTSSVVSNLEDFLETLNNDRKID